HCEYFASAMALMLRTVGIPARMVSGFKGGRWDERKKQLVIEQRHAHAWVEALVDGKWLVFDPTTGNGALAKDAFAEPPYSFASIRGWLNNFWQTHVIGVSLSRQRNDIYNPIRKRILAMQEWWTDFKQSFAEQNSSQPGRKWSMY